MFDVDRLSAAVTELRSQVEALEPECLHGSSATSLLKLFVEAERVASAGRCLVSRRVEETNSWQSEGYRSAAEFLAAKTGSPVGQVFSDLDTARKLEALPSTSSAFRSGELSSTQITHIARAASVLPSMEAQLLNSARSSSVRELQTKCRSIALSSQAEVANYESIRRRRYFRTWTESDGALRLDGRLCPDDGGRLLASLKRHRERIFKEARAAGRRESSSAYEADALVALSDERPGAASGGAVPSVNVTVDRSALKRGYRQGDETCEISGVGPIPVATAKALLSDAILKVIITDGSDVVSVRHVGRTVPSAIRTALAARDPVCAVPGCDVTINLEIDHRIPFADGGPTSLDNLVRICRWHHYLKTHRGFRLQGSPGSWQWMKPRETVMEASG